MLNLNHQKRTPSGAKRKSLGREEKSNAFEEENTMSKTRMTVGQAIVKFLNQQYIEMDGKEEPFVDGMFTIFGHGMVVGLGQALEEDGQDEEAQRIDHLALLPGVGQRVQPSVHLREEVGDYP